MSMKIWISLDFHVILQPTSVQMHLATQQIIGFETTHHRIFLMKKLILSLIALTAMVSAKAQYTAFPKWNDNWSVTLSGGAVHPVVYSPEFKLLTPSVGLGVKKQLSPTFSLGLEGDYISWNSRLNATRYERAQLYVMGGVNLLNLFAGYQGNPRLFEMEAKLGAGWGHVFNRARRITPDANYLVSKVGVDFQLNFGPQRRWGVSLQPGVRFDLRNGGAADYENFNINRAEFDLRIGVTYRFNAKAKNSIFEPPVTVSANQHEDLLEAVRYLHKDVEDRDRTIAQLRERLIAAEQSQGTVTRTNTNTKVVQKVVTSKQLESVITFNVGRVMVDAAQFPNVERVGSYLKKHPNARVIIRGYASPDGGAEVNARIAQLRADAVKNILIAQYGINAQRIDAAGQGVGNMFSESDWNRVAICTIIVQ